MIEANIIHAAYQNNVEKLMFLGSSCIYPKHAQPMKETALLTGLLEETNEWYALAKSQELSCAKLTEHNMVLTLYQQCQQIFMLHTIILI